MEFGLPYEQLNGDEKMIIKTQLIKVYRKNNIEKTKNLMTPANNETLRFSGKWYIIENSGDTNFYLSRHLEKNFSSEFINFYTTHSCVYQYYNLENNESKMGKVEWAIKNKILTLNDSGNEVNFKIEFLTKDKIILRKI